MSIGNLFKISYWFSQPHLAGGWLLWVLTVIPVSLVVAGIAVKIIGNQKNDKVQKEILRRFGNLGMAMGVLFLVWMFFRQEAVSFFAWRFWLLIWLLVLVWWLTEIIKYAVKRAPRIRRENENRERLEKYLPKRGL